jgi:predicted dehydrogenase
VDPGFPLVWRLQKQLAGSGAHGDLGAHLIDLARFLVGEFDQVVGLQRTFIRERPLPSAMTGLSASASTERGQVTVDDASLFMARFAGGAVGTFEATRFAPGRRNYLSLEINGSAGSVVFNLERMNELQLYRTDDPAYAQGFRTILVTDPVHPYATAWWPPGHIIGYEHTFIHEIADFMTALAHDEMPSPSFVDGVRCQQVMEAVDRSIEDGRWVTVSSV